MAEKWTNLGSIRSESSRGTAYGIDVNEDGTLLRCHCMSYIHSKEAPKTCKHVESSEAGRMLNAYQQSRQPHEISLGRINATRLLGGETYYSPSYSPPYVVLSETDFAKLMTITRRAKQYRQTGFSFDRSHLDFALQDAGFFL